MFRDPAASGVMGIRTAIAFRNYGVLLSRDVEDTAEPGSSGPPQRQPFPSECSVAQELLEVK